MQSVHSELKDQLNYSKYLHVLGSLIIPVATIDGKLETINNYINGKEYQYQIAINLERLKNQGLQILSFYFSNPQ